MLSSNTCTPSTQQPNRHFLSERCLAPNSVVQSSNMPVFLPTVLLVAIDYDLGNLDPGQNDEPEVFLFMVFLDRFQSHASPLCRHLMRAFSIKSGAPWACACRSAASLSASCHRDHLPTSNILHYSVHWMPFRSTWPILSANECSWYRTHPLDGPHFPAKYVCFTALCP